MEVKCWQYKLIVNSSLFVVKEEELALQVLPPHPYVELENFQLFMFMKWNTVFSIGWYQLNSYLPIFFSSEGEII